MLLLQKLLKTTVSKKIDLLFVKVRCKYKHNDTSLNTL